MSIPIYESSDDRRREAKVAHYVASRWSSIPVKSPDLAPFDYSLCRDGYAKAQIEIKCRNVHRDPYWLAVTKWDALSEIADITQLPTFLVVHCATTDLVRWCPIASPRPPITLGGRSDRPDDPKAVEPVVAIPLSRFRSLGPLDYRT